MNDFLSQHINWFLFIAWGLVFICIAISLFERFKKRHNTPNNQSSAGDKQENISTKKVNLHRCTLPIFRYINPIYYIKNISYKTKKRRKSTKDSLNQSHGENSNMVRR